ncbi:fasciclin domain-containing protein [Fibrella aestuarina]|uniref:Fasciclin domain-containing protein n=2 Tax=Fibrivirga algicola TaxID=2950420 RepID=A0ABX0QAA8_9BACT|nr:fasciclin domain-containing protein [Fibrivirga algicola]
MPGTMGSSSINRPSGTTSKETDKDLVDNLLGASDFSTLKAAMVASGLVDKAKGAGPYTVFAPSNAAFDKLPAGTVETLVKPENKGMLAGILAYHVVSGNVLAADLKDGQVIKTVGGGSLTVRKQGNAVMLTDAKGGSATVTVADIKATNGTVHAIDSVLMPK